MARSTEIGQALDGFLQKMAMAQQAKQANQAQAYANEVNAARFRNLEADTRATHAPLDAAQSLGAAITNMGDMPLGDVLAQNAGSYLAADFDPSRLSVFTPDAATRAGLYTAGGNAIGAGDAFTLPDREAVANRDLAGEMAQIFAKPVSVSAGGTAAFGAGDPRAASMGPLLQGRDTASTAEGRVINDFREGKDVNPLAAAVALPQSGSGTDFHFGPTGPDGQPLFAPLGKTPAQNAQATLISADQFKGTIGRYRKAIQDNPASVGLVGNVRGVFQDVQAQSDALANEFGFNGLQDAMATARADLQAHGVHGFEDFFDPAIPQVQQLGMLMAYSAASAVADQTGRGLSDKDLKYFMQIVGNPNAIFASDKGILAKLDTLETEVDSRIAANRRALRQGVPLGDSLTNPSTDQTSAPAGQVDYIFNAATGKLEPAR